MEISYSMANKNIQILFVSSCLLQRKSAEVVHLLNMCSALLTKGLKTVLCVPKFCEDKEKILIEYGIDCSFRIFEARIPKFFLRYNNVGRSFVFSCLFAMMVRKFECPLLYTREPWFFYIATVLFKKKCFLELHQSRFTSSLKTRIYHYLVRSGVRSSRGIIVSISGILMEQWYRIGIDRGKMYVAHSAVDTTKFNRSMSKEDARNLLKIDQNIMLIVYTGSMRPGKGVDVLVKAANMLPDIAFHIVGGKPIEIAKLKKLTKYSNINFIGQVPHHVVPLHQTAADILILPNTKGSVIDDVTSPIKLFEYMATGRPVITTDIPSILEVVTHLHNAFVCVNGDEYQLVDAITFLIKHPEIMQKLVSNADHSLQNYTYGARADFISKLIQDI